MQTNGESSKPRVTRSSKADLSFPVSRIDRYIRKYKFADRLTSGAPVYLAAVLEYLTSEMLELSGNAALDFKKRRINPKHIQLAIKHDEELNEIMKNITISNSGHFSLLHQDTKEAPPSV